MTKFFILNSFWYEIIFYLLNKETILMPRKIVGVIAKNAE